MRQTPKAWAVLLLLLAVSVPSLQDITTTGAVGPVDVKDYGYAEGHRKLLQGITVTVGYGSATFSVPTGGDALPALKKANDRLKAAGGGTVSIKAGTYTLSNQWIITAGSITVKGAGMTSTILKLKNSAPRFDKAGFIRFTTLKNMVFERFTIDGNKSKQKTTSASAMLKSSVTYGRYCFYADGFTNLKFFKVRTQNCQGYGFDPHGIKFDPTIWSRGIDIQYCESFNNGWDGFTIDQIIGGTVANNYAKGNGRHGFNVVTGTTDVVVKNNRAENNGFGKGEKSGNGCGYVVNDNQDLRTKRITVKDNTAKSNNKAGVCVLGAVDVTITGNTFDTSQFCGHITDAKTRRVKFTNNKCINTPKGLFIGQGAKASEVTVSGNTGL